MDRISSLIAIAEFPPAEVLFELAAVVRDRIVVSGIAFMVRTWAVITTEMLPYQAVAVAKHCTKWRPVFNSISLLSSTYSRASFSSFR